MTYQQKKTYVGRVRKLEDSLGGLFAAAGLKAHLNVDND